MLKLLEAYQEKFDGTFELAAKEPEECGEFRDPTIIENFNWIHWNLQDNINRSLVSINKIILNDYEEAKSNPLFKNFIQAQSKFLASPNYEGMIRDKYEGFKKHINMEIKVHWDTSVALRDTYVQLMNRVVAVL